MDDVKKFLKIKRKKSLYRPVLERVKDYKEALIVKKQEETVEQANRCMDCGTPFCHWSCPLGSYIPEFNRGVSEKNFQKAYQLVSAINPMPEITGRICPALCEYSCVLGINDEPVTIRDNELAVIEYAFNHGYVKPRKPKVRSGKSLAIIGSGPAGLSAANFLNQKGHRVVVYEKDADIGGILRYGIPDFKLDKRILDRRIKIWEEEGIIFKPAVRFGKDYHTEELFLEYDAVCLAIGAGVPRDLPIRGRQLNGIYFAMDYLTQSNLKVSGKRLDKNLISAEGENVVIIGGGDTGADCLGTALRQKARNCVQIELLKKPPLNRSEDYPWPYYPMILKTTTSHQEGGERRWAVLTKEFIGKSGQVQKLSCVKVEFVNKPHSKLPVMKEVPGSVFEIEADLVIIAAGFLHPNQKGLIKQLNLNLDKYGNIAADKNFMTNIPGIFTAGDAHRGQSLVVWAVSEGLKAGQSIDLYLAGSVGSGE